MGLAMATAIRQRAVKTSSGRATARGTGGLPALAPEGDSKSFLSDVVEQRIGVSGQFTHACALHIREPKDCP